MTKNNLKKKRRRYDRDDDADDGFLPSSSSLSLSMLKQHRDKFVPEKKFKPAGKRRSVSILYSAVDYMCHAAQYAHSASSRYTLYRDESTCSSDHSFFSFLRKKHFSCNFCK